ncbi:MAG: DEAD/DEAH box helicase [Candidatus Aenigmarchaeota archaeon]|nr:DEAD/DEAH box helicase [Candidatus Aenigmarchaeota archaeon]
MFSKLHPKIQKLIKERDWKEPTSAQEKAIPEIISGKNVLIIAPTGIGKTESAMLPIFSIWLDKKPAPISILYITPLRALNRDLMKRLLWWGDRLEMDISVRHGDTTQYERTKQSEFPPDLLISTPETLQAILPGSKMKKNLSNIKWVVIDEIHELATSKRGVQLSLGLERLRKLSGDFQVIGLSATVGSPDDVAKFLGKNVEVIKAMSTKDLSVSVVSPSPTKKDREMAEKIFLGADATARIRTIYNFVKDKKTLVFTNTREAAEILSSRLRSLEYDKHDIHHSSLSKGVRILAEDRFKNGELNVLICTSSLELGIDIGAVEQVIQYMSPRQVSKLVQRVGRSGHKIGERSNGIIIASDEDDIMEAGVIARMALSGELERIKFHELAYDVLAHQIVGMSLDKYDYDWKEMYELVKNSYLYRNLDKKEFARILKFMEVLRMIYLDTKVRRRRKAWEYYYDNLSTIPDVYQYRVIDNVENKEVGVLDEGFVAEHGETGTTFIVKGRPWRILSVYSGKVFVEPVDDITSAIPAWEGELIPVTREVAQEVGDLRRKISDMIDSKMKDEDVIEEIQKTYPISLDACKKVLKYIKKQKNSKKMVPDNKKILIEGEKDFIVIHSCFGSMINQTLSRFFSAILSANLGRSVAIKNDPYRIIIQGASRDDVLNAIEKNDPDDFEIVIDNTIERTQMFRWRFIHIAKRFGAITKKARWDKVNMSKIIETFRDTPIFEEAKREVYLEKLDMEGAKEVFKMIKNGGIEVFVDNTEKLSPIGKVGVEYQFRELVAPEKPEKEIFETFKERLLNTEVRLVCMKCGKYSVTRKVKSIEKDPECPVCGSRFITVIRPYQRDMENIIKKNLSGKALTHEEEKKLSRMESIADLVLTYGSKVILALAGRGVGPDTAIRILAKQRENEDDFFKDILEAERQFARTKRYWN